MKRTKIIMAFLLCACLIVGVGYAAVADVLDVDGTAEYGITSDFDGKIEFTNAKAYSVGDTASVSSTNGDKVTFTATSVSAEGDYAFFQFTLVNNNADDAIVYLSNYIVSGTITDTEGAATDGKNVYDIQYAFCEHDHASADEIYTNTTPIDAVEGTKSYEESNPNNTTIPAGATRYLYIAVSLDDVEYPDGFPAGTVSATFGLEFSVWTND